MNTKETEKRPNGRPTKWYPELNDELVAHFSGDYTREVAVTFIDKKGNEMTKYEEKANSVPTFQRFCADRKLDSAIISEWIAEEDCEEKRPGFRESYKRAKDLQHDWVVANTMTGYFNPAFAIFFAKNNMGMRDKVETDITSNGASVAIAFTSFAEKAVSDESDEQTDPEITA